MALHRDQPEDAGSDSTQPRLTSTGGSLPEVAGDAAVSVDPYDVQAMTRGLRALDADEALRDDLVRRGLVQSAKFSVEAYQGRLAQMYGRLGLS